MTFTDRIKAVHVLQRFVMMSRSLLPRFSELMLKKNPSATEKQKINNIKNVYASFEANSEISKNLINSNIFELIKEVYRATILPTGQTPKTFHIYDEFLKESDRLIDTWNKQQLN